jgi:hypothetical protein
LDLALYLRVLWRFRLIVACGLVIAFGLALLSVVKISFDGGPKLVYRESPQYASDATLQVTTKGFPSGHVQTEQGQGLDQSTLPELAITYSQYVTSDAVRRLIAPGGKIHGIVKSNSLVDSNTGSALAFLLIRGISSTPASAVALTERAARALQVYILREQQRNHTPDAQRTILVFNNHAGLPVLLQGRSKTRPIFVFLAVMIATMGLAFILENLRPRIRPVDAEQDDRLSRQSRLSA